MVGAGTDGIGVYTVNCLERSIQKILRNLKMRISELRNVAELPCSNVGISRLKT